MDVSQILKLLATLSIGLDDIDVDNPLDGDVIVYMQFINLAYLEIIQSTISQNPLVVKLNEAVDCNNGILSPTTKPIFIPKSIYNVTTNIPLIPTIEENILKKDPGIKQIGKPQEWYYANGVLNVYPLTTNLVNIGGGYGVRYIAQPPPLTNESVSSDILIPPLFQQVLADGASYYLFQSETGFKDQVKMQAALARWEIGKKKLFSYMTNISGDKFLSTYSPI